jgi:hypothetical protein
MHHSGAASLDLRNDNNIIEGSMSFFFVRRSIGIIALFRGALALMQR